MRKFLLLTALSFLLCGSLQAQTDELKWQRLDRDSLPPGLSAQLLDAPNPQHTDDRYREVVNRFWSNWFVLADFGMHTFRGDWSGHDKFKKTISPDFNIGVGKWFTPGFGIKAQFGVGNSRGYTEIWTPYARGNESEPMYRSDGTPYWRLKTKWWDINANVMLNLTRIIDAWEGYDTKEHSNQFILSLGLGGIHHIGDFSGWGEPYGGPHNEWFANAELQYSRFFTKAKAVSLDVKLRGRFYETHFDLSPIAGRRWDYNVGLNVGLTYYFKERGWQRCHNCDEPAYYVSMPTVVEKTECPEYKTFTFYVFYPNNYSGRDDAPVVAGAEVNSMDYLAGGVFTQKGFESNSAVEGRLDKGGSLRTLATADVATEKATFIVNKAGVPRGYEMTPAPISLSMETDSLRAFAGRTGYYYSPVYKGDKTWYYRVDGETATQKLLSLDNYREDISYCLNAHAGLDIVRANTDNEESDDVYSFADVYAAIEGNEGHVAACADPATVEEIRRILAEGKILLVQSEGVATSQDNYTGENAEEVGLTRNKTLSFNRAWSAVKWLRESKQFKGVGRDRFVLNTLTEPISTVNDESTRGLNAKLNRCARIRITYMINK